MSQLQLFARLAKVDEAKRQVTGIIASETPDAANEVFDYDSSKGNFEAWSANVAKASGGKSVGNVRAMHGNVAVGTLEEITFDDVAKTISVVANVVDDNEWNKVLKGVYTGFSIGGKYVKKWADTVNKSLKRYTAQPSEVSLVDVGCNFDAVFSLCKADGMESEVRWEDTHAGILAKMTDADTDPAMLPELAAKLAKAYGHAIAEPVVGEPDGDELAKGAWSLESLARAAESAEFIALGYGVNIDGTVRTFTDDVKKAAGLLYDALVKMVGEDVAAAKERLKGIKKQLDDDEGEKLQKRADEFTLVVGQLDSLCKALGIEDDGDTPRDVRALEKISSFDELKKSLDERQTELDAANVELEKLRGQAAPAKGAVKAPVAIGKGEDGLNKHAASGTEPNVDTKDPLAMMKLAQSRPIQIGVGHRFDGNGS